MYLGDPCMFAVNCLQREAVWAWATATNVAIEYAGNDFGLDVWRVVKPEHCSWFELRWM